MNQLDDILDELNKELSQELALDRLAEMFPELASQPKARMDAECQRLWGKVLEAPGAKRLAPGRVSKASPKADRDPARQSLRHHGVLVDIPSGRAYYRGREISIPEWKRGKLVTRR